MRAGQKKESEREPDEQGSVKASSVRPESAVKENSGHDGSAESHLTPAQSAVLGLQRSHGNQFVVRMLQRKCACGGVCAKCSAEREEGAAVASGAVAEYIARPGGGKELDAETRDAMESRLGHDFGEVRVHNDNAAAAAAESLDAQAFTVGKDLFFAGGKYRGDSADPLLAHELTHVAQQAGGGGSTSAPAGGAQHEAQAEAAEHTVAGGSRGSVAITAGARGVQRKADDGSAGATTAPPQKAKPPSAMERAGHDIAGAAKTIWGGIKAVGSAIGSAASAVGHAVAGAAEAVWNGIKWVGKQLWSKAEGAFQRVMQWARRLPERLKRLVMGLWEGVKTLHPWALKWWESLGKVDTWLGFLQWLGKNAIYVLEVGGFGEAYETAMEFVKFNTRPLSASEISKAHSVFGGSIRLDLVRVDQHAAIGPLFTKREYTSFHTINGWGGIEDSTLIHELTHVWQYERAGAIYIAQALYAQFKFGDAAYQYKVQDLRNAKTAGQGILSFNREKQAQIVEDFYRIKTNQTVTESDGTRADLPLYAHFVKEVSTRSEADLAV